MSCPSATPVGDYLVCSRENIAKNVHEGVHTRQRLEQQEVERECEYRHARVYYQRLPDDVVEDQRRDYEPARG